MEQTIQPTILKPQFKQAQLIACPANEILFGGARGGGKTAALLLDFLSQYKILKGKTRGVIFRRTYAELDDIVSKCREFLEPWGFVRNKGDNVYTHPSGAFLKLRYLESPDDADNYQGHEYSWLGFDEVGNFKSFLGIDKLKSTIRGSGLPPRIVVTANPGGRGHTLIKERYSVNNPYKIDTSPMGWSRCYIPSLFSDNLILMEKDPAYLARATEDLPEYLRRAWEYGDWNISSEAGMFFSREDFEIIEPHQVPGIIQSVRCWDRAASEPSESYPDPDWTVGVKIGVDHAKNFYILDVIRFRKRASDVKSKILQTAQLDGMGNRILLFQDPGQAGKDQSEDMARSLSGFYVTIQSETGAKHVRWSPFSASVQNKITKLVRAPWNAAFIDELVMLTDNDKDYAHDDQADGAAGAYNLLNKNLLDVSPLVFAKS
ncbi:MULTISPECIES: phage terminase large subunit [Leptospira]|uniref:phage terminase large subunit n=1 Tax=Leptospira TaxID=171 RepID=UPI000C2A2150|nr:MULTISPECIES: phage terminase large subunit [Leptospira]PJZ87923.1 hypothetical protein CH368_14270 [Leptospira levettii]TGN08580.1 hypothetical protein EHR07_03425 [Leptospira bandrabouensis]